MKYILVLFVLLLLAACEPYPEKYRMADDQVLCNHKGQAFIITRVGRLSSLVKRNEELDKLCKELK